LAKNILPGSSPMKSHRILILNLFLLFLLLTILPNACVKPDEVTQTPDPTEVTQTPGPTEVTQTPGPTEVTQTPGPTEVTQTPGPTEVTQTLGPTNTPIPMTPTPPPPPPEVKNRGLLFLLDSSKSVHEYCGEQLHILYEIPELFISFLATYDENENGFGETFVRPSMGWFIYPPAAENNPEQELNHYDEFKQNNLRRPEDYLHPSWYSEIEDPLKLSQRAFGYSAVLSSARQYINNTPEIEHLVIVMITDGVINYVTENNSNKAEAERRQITEAINDLKTLDAPEVDIIVMQLPCNVPDNDKNNINENPFKALNADKEDFWLNLQLVKRTISFIQGTSTAELVEALINNDAFSKLLPEKETNNGGWLFRSSEEIVEIPTTVEAWQITAQFISPEAIKDENDSVQFYLTNPQRDDLRMLRAGMVYARPNIPDFNPPPPDCQTSLPWLFTIKGEQAGEIRLGFLKWQTTFPLASLQFDSVNGVNLVNGTVPDYILNREQFKISVRLFDRNFSRSFLDEYRKSDCYSIRLAVIDEDGNKLNIDELEKSFATSTESTLSWEIALENDPQFLTHGPQTLTLYAEVLRNNISVAQSNSLQLETFFLPAPSLVEPSYCGQNNGPNRCLLNIPMSYLGNEYYDDIPLSLEVFVATDLREPNSDDLTVGFRRGGCVVDDQYISEHSYRFSSPRHNPSTSNGLFQLKSQYIQKEANNLNISIPKKWFWETCSYDELIIRFLDLPKSFDDPERTNEVIIVCELNEQEGLNKSSVSYCNVAPESYYFEDANNG
jgi:hypothetical protein